MDFCTQSCGSFRFIQKLRERHRNIPWAHLINTLHQNGTSVPLMVIALTRPQPTQHSHFELHVLGPQIHVFYNALYRPASLTSDSPCSTLPIFSQVVSKPPDSIGSRSSDLTPKGSKCRQMVEPRGRSSDTQHGGCSESPGK